MNLTQLQKILEDAAAFCDDVYTRGIEEKSTHASDLYDRLDAAATEIREWMAQEEEPT